MRLRCPRPRAIHWRKARLRKATGAHLSTSTRAERRLSHYLTCRHEHLAATISSADASSRTIGGARHTSTRAR